MRSLSRHKHLWDGLAIILLCLLALAFYRHIALTNRVLSGVDAFTYFYPYRAYAAETIRSGRIPLWNPYLFMGVPFLANSQAAVFYPLNLLLCWLPAPRLVAWSIVLHVAMAATFSYLYARHALRLLPIPAFLGASAFAFGGFLSGQVEHVNQLNVSAWFPLLLLLWELRRHPRSRWSALLGMGTVVGVGLLAGHAQSSYISLVGLGVYAVLPCILPQRNVHALPSTFDRTCGRHREHGEKKRLDRCDLGASHRCGGRSAVARIFRVLWSLGFVSLIGVGLAAVQLLPTLELSRLSIRSGGLSYQEAVAFSLKPLPPLLWHTFLPPWGRNLADVFGGSFFTEYVAYVGVFPLLLAALSFGFWSVRCSTNSLHEDYLRESPSHLAGRPSARLFVLACLGVFLALGLYNPLYFVLYKVIPGFALFRVPARWLFLYAFGVAMLAGIGLQQALDWLRSHLSPPAPVWKWVRLAIGCLSVALALIELFAAARAFPFSDPTAPEAFSSLRTAPAHILAAQGQEIAPGRFLSLSDILFDPGDLGDIRQVYRGQLSEKALYDYVVCAKRKEIAAPNLPLAWQMYAVDGYDGGVLPLERYIRLQRLFLSGDEILTDGRLREGLKRIPPARLLSILGARYVITDKVHDVWIDDVFYDLAFDAVLGTPPGVPSISSRDLPHFAATALGVVSYLEGGTSVRDGVPVAEIRLTTERGDIKVFTLYAGRDTAEGVYDDRVAHAQARIRHGWRERPGGNDYVTRLRWESPLQVTRIEVVALPFEGQIHIRGLTLIDERDGSNVPLVLSTDGRFRRVHSGDVKIYEVIDALPRAYVVHQTRVAADDEAAIAAMADPTFDPAQTAILSSRKVSPALRTTGGPALVGQAERSRHGATQGGQEVNEAPSAESQATVTAYEPESITVRASLQAPGYLVLSDTWYPGWQATVDGEPAPIERANLHFRALYLAEGTHIVRFAYKPIMYSIGLGISALTLAGVLVAVVRRTLRGVARSKKLTNGQASKLRTR